MLLKTIGHQKHARLVDDKPTASWTITLSADEGAQLSFVTSDEALARRFVYGASLDVDVSAVKAPPSAKKAAAAEVDE